MAMKLTLRTMLAYMDQILEPAEAKDMAGKIQESDFAAGLMNKIKGATKNAELPSPTVSGAQMLIDPNRVAEYLDNVVPLDQVEEFEKSCLAPGVMGEALLAELASSHTCLTLILGKPAEVDPKLREKMYPLIEKAQKLGPDEESEAAKKSGIKKAAGSSGVGKAAAGSGINKNVNGAAAKAADNVAASKSGVLGGEKVGGRPSDSEIRRREKPAVPDYLREEQGTSWLIPAAAVLALVAIGAIFFATANNSTNVAQNDPPKIEEKDTETKGTETKGTEEPKGPDTKGTETKGTETKGAETKGTETNGTDTKGPDTKGPDETKAPEVKGPEVKGPEVKGPETKGPEVKGPEETKGPEVKGPETKGPEVKGPETKGPETKGPETKGPEVKGPETKGPETKGPETKGPETKGPETKGPETKGPEGRPAVAKVEMGQFTTPDSLLLTHNTEKSDWQRLRPQSVVVSGSRMITLPTFRSTIELTDGLVLEALGGSIIELEAPDAQGAPRLRIITGQVAVTANKPGLKLALLFGENVVNTTFGQGGETAVGFDIRPRRPFGTDPENIKDSPIQYEALYSVATGQATFDNGTNSLTVDKPPSSGTLLPLREISVDEAPWIKSNVISTLDQQAKRMVEPFIQPGELVTIRLKELADHRRAEVALLALRGLVFIGQYEPVIKALQVPELRPTSRTAILLQLGDNVRQSPENAKALHDALKQVRGERADDLYRMYWGYTRAQLERGEAARLVEFLDHDDLDMRVLAFWNLEDITGMNLLYRPEMEKGPQRTQAVQRWQQKLEAKQIVPKS